MPFTTEDRLAVSVRACYEESRTDLPGDLPGDARQHDLFTSCRQASPYCPKPTIERVSVDDVFARFLSNLTGRFDGPFTLRLALQPIMAAALAVRSGVADGRAGHPPYFWAIATSREHRWYSVRDGWKAISTVFGLAVVLDGVYQVIAFGWIYPFEALLVGFLLACVPYVVVRGIVGRLSQPSGGVPALTRRR